MAFTVFLSFTINFFLTFLRLGFVDAMTVHDLMSGDIGRTTILSASFTGGKRHMVQVYQDGMAMVREFGRPDLFVTFTCNPAWTEIKELLLDHQGANYDPVTVTRIFKQKLLALLDVVIKDKVFGIVAAHVLTIEFQKWGLPDAHILFTLAPERKLVGPEDCDAFVSAEILDPIMDEQLHAVVTKTMMHGPCSSRCLGPKGTCSKRLSPTLLQCDHCNRQRISDVSPSEQWTIYRNQRTVAG
jgi:hypothetical protein